MAKKRIAIFNDFQRPIPPVGGGSVPNLINMILLENEIKQKYDIDIYVCKNKQAQELSKNYKHTKFIFVKDAGLVRFITNFRFKLFKNRKLETSLPLSIRSFYKKQHYDMVYIVAYIRGALSIIKASNAPCVYHHHTVTDLINEPTISGGKIIDCCKKVCFVSDFARDFAKTGTEEQNSKMITFPNAIDQTVFHSINKEKAREEIRNKYGIGKYDTVINFTGRLVEYKGALEVIKAFNLSNFNSSVKLLIVGSASYDTKNITPYIQQCLEEASKNKNIIFTGYVKYEEIAKVYFSSDIGTLMSLINDAAPLISLEYMAAGIPVITSDRGGIPNYLPKECKIVVKEGDNFVERLSDALKELVNNKQKVKQMGEFALNYVKQFDRESYYNSFCNLVENVTKI